MSPLESLPRPRPVAARRRSRFAVAATLSAALAAGLAATLAASPPARADDDGGAGGDELQQKIRAQMEKILELMRSSEKQLLEASRVGGTKPVGPEVKPPDLPPKSATPPEAGTPPSPESGGGAGHESDGERAKKAIEEVLRSGGKVPHELEELVRMIPLKSGKGSGQPQPDSGTDPNPEANSESQPRRETGQPEPQDANQPKPKEESSGKDKPEGGKPKEKPETTTTPDGDKGGPTDPGLPPWIVSLPELIREQVIHGDPARVPPAYRELIVRYHKWLAEHAKGSGR